MGRSYIPFPGGCSSNLNRKVKCGRYSLIDDMTITTVPILLGAGRRLFDTLPSDMKLRLVSHRAFEFGFTQSTYSARTDA